MLFNMMKTCIDIQKPEDLWIYTDDTAKIQENMLGKLKFMINMKKQSNEIVKKKNVKRATKVLGNSILMQLSKNK